MTKVEAVVIRDRVETVIDAVEEQTGHVGVTVIEAIGHGRQRGITHEYRGRIFESRFLPKAVLTFIVDDEHRGGGRRSDRRRRAQRQRVGRRDRVDVPGAERHPQPDRTDTRGGGDRMTTQGAAIATSTVWVIVAAVLVMFMQAGFAFLEAGLTRMKNVGHIAAKNVLILAIASVVYFVVGFGIAFGDGGNGLVGGSGFFPSIDELLTVGAAPFSWFSEVPGAAGYLFEVVFCGVSLAIVWGAMAERTKLWVYFAFGASSRSSTPSSRTGSGARTAGSSRRACRTSPARPSSTTRAHSPGSPGRSCSARASASSAHDGKPNAIPGHNMAFTTLGVIILWFGWFGFNPGSTLSVDFGGVGFFAYVALNTNLAAAAGVLGAVITSWLVIKKPDLSMMLNGAVAALVAITAACAFVAPWAAIVIGLVAGVIVVLGVAPRRAGPDRRPDRRDRRARHGRRLGNAVARLPRRCRLRPRGSRPEAAVCSTAAASTSSACRCSASPPWARSRSASRSASSGLMKVTVGIRTEPEAETAGLDVSEHGMWGYPEFYIPCRAGTARSRTGHLGLGHAARYRSAAATTAAASRCPSPPDVAVPVERGRAPRPRSTPISAGSCRPSRHPLGVSTDSGWNCTPSTRSVRWRTPMTSSSSVRAVTTSSSGTVIAASEW